MAEHNRTIQFLGFLEWDTQSKRECWLNLGVALQNGAIAQLVERLLCKQDVRSSSLLSSTNLTGL